MLSDIEIARSVTPKPIEEVAASVGIPADALEFYGKSKAKISESFIKECENRPDGKLVLVTAINPTPMGEGKTTTSVGIGEAMDLIGKKAIIALREPSLGPVFGVKGGAAGGGYAQVIPMEDINLHFTGDMHAITAANNLLCALIDNHIQQGNVLGIDARRILFKRCMDMNDRALRNVVISLGGKPNGFPREDGFNITVASEVMAILCLSRDLRDLKERLGKIIVAYNLSGEAVTAHDLHAEGAMTALLKEAIKPNLVQTLTGTPALMHGGPFANIAHGCNSVRATRLALKLADYTITEAGFGSDLGAEKFFDIKCQSQGIKPNCVVIVATVRALKYNGGVKKADVGEPNVEALKAGLCNLGKHIENMHKFGIPVVVAINRFLSDTDEELSAIEDYCTSLGADFSLSEVFAKGAEGGRELCEKIVAACEKPSEFKPLYAFGEGTIKDKITKIATEIYGAKDVQFAPAAVKAMAEAATMGGDNMPVCMAKTQYSLSDDAKKLGRPEGFTINVKEIRLNAGAGFIVALTGDIMTMPGLPKIPAANNIDVDDDGNIIGLF